MKRGKFIILEGGEGAGKSTLTRFLSKQFPEKQMLTTSAGGTPLGEKIKKVLVSPETATSSPESQFFLAWAAHTDHATQLLVPILAKGIHILSDRFDSTTFAYQVYGSGAPHLRKLFFDLRKDFLKECEPDLYIFLDVAPEEGLRRVKACGKATDYFEQKPLDFHARVREGYLEFLKTVPSVIVDANRPLESVQKEVISIVQEHL